MRRILVPLLLVAGFALTACNREAPVVPVDEASKARDRGANGIETVVVTADAGKFGSALAPDQSIATPKTTFAVGETVYLSVPAKNKTPGTNIEVFWFHADGRSRKEETKTLEGPHVAFDFIPQEAGKYNVEIDVNGRPIGLSEFVVQ